MAVVRLRALASAPASHSVASIADDMALRVSLSQQQPPPPSPPPPLPSTPGRASPSSAYHPDETKRAAALCGCRRAAAAAQLLPRLCVAAQLIEAAQKNASERPDARPRARARAPVRCTARRRPYPSRGPPRLPSAEAGGG